MQARRVNGNERERKALGVNATRGGQSSDAQTFRGVSRIAMLRTRFALTEFRALD
jgi:hypothetical protein